MLDIFLQLLDGFGTTVLLFAVTLVLSLPLGLFVCFLSMSKIKIIKGIARAFVSIIRGTPLMLQLIIIFYGPGLVFGAEFSFKSRLLAAIIAFTINYAAYFSEIYRGGIESIPKGQKEAGKVLGLSKGQIFSKIVLLQVIKHIVPPIGNEIITLVKDTSIARMIALVELTDVAFDLRKAQGGGLWPLLAAGLFYFAFNALVAFILRKIEKKLSYIKV
ncbi:MAG: amino acid ABC transporter permease [Clostridiales bacterium]|nr:amino acid ABC transporter permease [Clostridiales bacterium]